jgi:hypothetical protein
VPATTADFAGGVGGRVMGCQFVALRRGRRYGLAFELRGNQPANCLACHLLLGGGFSSSLGSSLGSGFGKRAALRSCFGFDGFTQYGIDPRLPAGTFCTERR